MKTKITKRIKSKSKSRMFFLEDHVPRLRTSHDSAGGCCNV
jgi:hypothetical protein